MSKGKIGSRLNTAAGVINAVDAAVSLGGHAAGLIPTHRQCDIKITNQCCYYTLRHPSGYCSKHLPLHIEPRSSGSALFTKTGHAARGAVGVFTYDLIRRHTRESGKKIAVMFSVPYDFNLYSNWCAVGIFDQSKVCNYDLYCEMYYNTEYMFARERAGSSLSHSNGQLSVTAFMTDSFEPVLEVEVRDN